MFFFEDPFWVGVFERVDGERFSVCKITFGAEPKEKEILDFLLNNYAMLRFSPSLDQTASAGNRINPKRQQRLVKKQIETIGIGTKAQQALKLQRDQGKQEKRKQKHKGR